MTSPGEGEEQQQTDQFHDWDHRPAHLSSLSPETSSFKASNCLFNRALRSINPNRLFPNEFGPEEVGVSL